MTGTIVKPSGIPKPRGGARVGSGRKAKSDAVPFDALIALPLPSEHLTFCEREAAGMEPGVTADGKPVAKSTQDFIRSLIRRAYQEDQFR